MMYPFMGLGYGYGFSALSFLMMFVWWAIVIAVVVLAIRWIVSAGNHSARRHGSALEILKERYAKGEIDRKEFEERKKDILA